MANVARWMRLGRTGPGDLLAACSGLALAQESRADPIVLWAQPNAPVLGDLVRIEENQHAFVLIVPRRLAPGRISRWRAWGLAPVLATYRHFGVRAYFDDGAVRLNGRTIGECGAQAINGCAVIASSFLPRLPEALADWPEPSLETVFRNRIEAQHGWQFDNSWPTAREQAAIADALAVEDADAR